MGKPPVARPLPLNGGRNGALRLVEVGLSWPPETFIGLKLMRLAERGVEVTVGSFVEPDAPPDALPGVRFEALPEKSRDLEGQLRQMRADVLHFEWLTVASSCARLIEAWDGPVVVSCRGSDLPADAPIHQRPAASALRDVFARADAVHCVADATRREALAFGLSPEKACLIRAGVDVELFRPPPDRTSADAAFSVVSVGWLRWLKGYEYAVLAVAELAHRGIPVTLDVLGGDPRDDTGEQSQRTRILHTARDLGVGDRVRLHGNVEPASVSAHLRRAHAFLHTSLSEGLPNVIVEAMACALPVVATDVGGTREAIDDGVEGFLTPPPHPVAAAAALGALWQDAGLRERMGAAGRSRVQAEFTIDRQTQEWLELYERVAAVA
jgi:glycosyltransferase involved in cell wall biosynthesis